MHTVANANRSATRNVYRHLSTYRAAAPVAEVLRFGCERSENIMCQRKTTCEINWFTHFVTRYRLIRSIQDSYNNKIIIRCKNSCSRTNVQSTPVGLIAELRESFEKSMLSRKLYFSSIDATWPCRTAGALLLFLRLPFFPKPQNLVHSEYIKFHRALRETGYLLIGWTLIIYVLSDYCKIKSNKNNMKIYQ